MAAASEANRVIMGRLAESAVRAGRGEGGWCGVAIRGAVGDRCTGAVSEQRWTLIARSRMPKRMGLGAAVARGFVNDVRLAVTCREARFTLVPDNMRDFARIARVLRFELVGPGPMPSS